MSGALVPVPRRSTGITVEFRMSYELRYADWERKRYGFPAENAEQERAHRKRWLFETN